VARIANINIPDNKRLVISLTYIYGIGINLSQQICKIAEIDESVKVKNLTNENLVKLRELIEKEYKVEGDLRKEINFNIKKKKDIKCYQGLRHINRLPVRGQNTHSNARTRKGKAVAIAGKKKPAKK
jgi:small subunit ribosomal protein S13